MRAWQIGSMYAATKLNTKGHNDLRIPRDRYFYDQSQLDVIRSQVVLMQKFRVYGFCHSHHWFDGQASRRVVESIDVF